MRVLAVDGSPSGGGRTAAILRVVTDAAADAGADVSIVGLADAAALDAALEAAEGADAFVFGSPVYRASYAAPLKAFLDRLPRGMWGERTAPVTGRAVAIVCTGATWHHYLALDGLRNVLAGFFAAHVLSPGLYVPGEAFAAGEPDERTAALARQTGAGLVALANAVAGSDVLRGTVPQA